MVAALLQMGMQTSEAYRSYSGYSGMAREPWWHGALLVLTCIGGLLYMGYVEWSEYEPH